MGSVDVFHMPNMLGLAHLQLDPKRLQRHSLSLQHNLNFVEHDFPRRKQSRPRLKRLKITEFMICNPELVTLQSTQRPSIDINKRFLPRPNTTTA